MATWNPRANDIFLDALEVRDPAARAAFVDEACRGEPELREQVLALLAATEQAGSFLDRPAVTPGATGTFEPSPEAETGPVSSSEAEAVGAMIGPYKLLQQLGEGGMGTVYMAEQTHPVRRQVALKVIKAGMDCRQVVARFEAERQALALMDHVNIARVFDGGTTDSGRPYFVMELVRGVPITKYCDDNHLTPRQRLELFVPVCQAIQHAHQKGIIHRDIKPSNVMVTLYDGKPVPKVIDFGVAKATEQKLTDRTLFTQYGSVVGTLEYMSPEQAEMSALGVDTRSDIYSLGVLLYELLTGSTPLGRNRMKQAAFAEIIRLIKEEEPPRPSTRLSDSGEALASISAQRHMEPAKLTKLVRGELDWIVMKCLEKDRGRRYETANAFAADVQRYLNDETVQACPPSAGYRFRKFVRRNKRALASAALLAVAVLAVAGTLGWAVRDRGAREADRVREQARLQAERASEQAALQATAAATAARAEQALAESEVLYRQRKLPDAIQVVRSVLVLVDGGAGGPEVHRRAREWLKDLEMVARLEELHPRGGNAAQLRSVEYPRAFREYGIDIEVLPPDEAAARIAARPIRVDLAVALDRWGLWLGHGPGGEKRAALLARFGHIARIADPDPLRTRVRDVLAANLQAGGKYNSERMRELAASVDLATTPLVTLMMIGDEQYPPPFEFYTRVQQQHPNDYEVNSRLGYLHGQHRSDPTGSIRFLTAAVAIRPQSAYARQALGYALWRTGLVDEAIATFREAARLDPTSDAHQRALGGALLRKPGSEKEAAVAFRESVRLAPDAATGLDLVGTSYREARKYDEAIAAHREAIRLKPDVAVLHYGLGFTLDNKGSLDGAIAAHREALRLQPDLVAAHQALGEILYKQKKVDEAIAEYRECLRLAPRSTRIYDALGNCLQEKGLLADAIAAYQAAIGLAPNFAAAHNGLGTCLYKQKKFDEAIIAYREVVRIDPKSSSAYNGLGNSFQYKGRPDEAIAAYRDAIRVRPDSATSYLNLAGVLTGRGRFDEAIAAARDAVRLQPDSLSAHFHLGQALFLKGPPDAALDALQEAARLATSLKWDHPRTRSLYARALSYRAWILANPDPKLRDVYTAVELAKKAVETAPEHGECWKALGVAHYRTGNWKDAIAALEKACQLLDGGGSYEFYPLAMVHWRLGEKETARKYYDRALEWTAKNKAVLAQGKTPGFNAVELDRFRAEAAELLGVGGGVEVAPLPREKR